MKLTDTKIARYTDGKFLIDIVETPDTFEAWLAYENYCVSELMFSVPKGQQTYDEFLETVEANLPDYERFYAEKNIDEDDFSLKFTDTFSNGVLTTRRRER